MYSGVMYYFRRHKLLRRDVVLFNANLPPSCASDYPFYRGEDVLSFANHTSERSKFQISVINTNTNDGATNPDSEPSIQHRLRENSSNSRTRPIDGQKIVEHREKHGLFKRPEHLMRIQGISDVRFRRIRHLIRVE